MRRLMLLVCLLLALALAADASAGTTLQKPRPSWGAPVLGRPLGARPAADLGKAREGTTGRGQAGAELVECVKKNTGVSLLVDMKKKSAEFRLMSNALYTMQVAYPATGGPGAKDVIELRGAQGRLLLDRKRKILYLSDGPNKGTFCNVSIRSVLGTQASGGGTPAGTGTPTYLATRVASGATATLAGRGRAAMPEAAPDGGVHARRVRVSVVKIEAVKPTKDAKKDGKGDEILVAARGLWYKLPNNIVVSDFKYKSPTFKGMKAGSSVSTNLEIFNRVLGDSDRLILIVSLWEEDKIYKYLDRFLNDEDISGVPVWGWYSYDDPEERIARIDAERDDGYRHLFNRTYCENPAEYITLHLGLHTLDVGRAKRRYTLPVTLNDGYNLSLNHAFIDKISRIDCGYGPGVAKFMFRWLNKRGKSKVEYYMYVRFETSPAPGS